VNLSDRINACTKLGEILRNPDKEKFHSFRMETELLNELVANLWQSNSWFTPENVKSALHAIGVSLKPFNTEKWLKRYPSKTFEKEPHKKIAVILAGNLPLVGFHDYLAVLITGNVFIGKMSSSDNKLLPLIHRIFSKIEPGFTQLALFTEDRLADFDAVIATGSNNTSRYFEYYFGKYPHIIRKNRNSIALLDGSETHEQIAALGEDIFKYFGLGCRSVSKLYVPKGYDFKHFFEAVQTFQPIIEHQKYRNNYDYQKSILLINRTQHLENGFLLLTKDKRLSSPVSVLYYEEYENTESVVNDFLSLSDAIQCIVSANHLPVKSVKPGFAQKPNLWDYADGIDTVEFLSNLK
jgi:hypothetical protein